MGCWKGPMVREEEEISMHSHIRPANEQGAEGAVMSLDRSVHSRISFF